MREITSTIQMIAKQYVGDEPMIVVSAEGEILDCRTTKAAAKVRTVVPASATILVGTEAEIAAEQTSRKAASDAIKTARRIGKQIA